jgi:hypothetical protein
LFSLGNKKNGVEFWHHARDHVGVEVARVRR